MRNLVPMLFLLLALLSCAGQESFPPPLTVATFPAPATALPSPDPFQGEGDTTPEAASPTVVATPAAASTATATVAATPMLSLDEWRATVSRELAENAPPLRDDVELAVAYRGVERSAATPPAQISPQVGAIETFNISNVDNNTVHEITAELRSIGENAYFWFDLEPTSAQPSREELADVAAAFDTIYETLDAYFGVSQPAGGRVHIVHASASTLCNDADNCRLAGYFSGRDMLPKSINPSSNERPMFVMNSRQYGGERYLDVLAHELRHMLGAEYDMGDEDWFIEGAATLAQELVGFTDTPQFRGSLFLTNPDQQLNSWTDEDTSPYYGQGYLVNRFVLERLGPALYREYSISPEPGLAAVDAVAARAGREETGLSLWLDWLAAMALIDSEQVDARYRWRGPDLAPVAVEGVEDLPASFSTTVSQYAADYYALPSGSPIQINFDGAPLVSLLGTDAPSGEWFWYAQRANESNPRLTRAVDLRDVDDATLTYRVYADIEQGYDFAYVSVSVDGGERWTPLVAPKMQGAAPDDDPSDSALAERFYTGRIRAWADESVDLSEFAGQEILLRFEYVTDLIQTYGGFVLDDIAISEVGFFDDAESLASGWVAEGFTRATTTLPQNWHLQLVTFDEDGQPKVEPLPVGADSRLQFVYQGEPRARRPILIVAATAPETLQPAAYRLSVDLQ